MIEKLVLSLVLLGSPGVAVDTWHVTHFYDGDTISAANDDTNEHLVVRVIGIDTPERYECLYDEATAALIALVAGQPIVLVSEITDVDIFGRSLRYIETVDGVDLGAQLVAVGLAAAAGYKYPPDTSRSEHYLQLELDAQQAHLGIWDPLVCPRPLVAASASAKATRLAVRPTESKEAQ